MRRTRFLLGLLIGIVVLGGFFRFYQIKEIPLGLYPDEAMNGNNALEAIATGNFKIFYPENNGREGLFINMQALSVWLLGNAAWALRIVSAVLGTLTILGVYLAGRELFEENPKHEARNPKQYQNPNTQNSKPFRSFGFRILNFFRISNFEFRISRGEVIALLAAFFTATSYWHLNFSRIGFRAITLPFFATFAMYFLLKGLRKERILDLVWAGIFMGLGFHGYIAFRFMPFVAAVPILMYLWRWRKETKNEKLKTKNDNEKLKIKAEKTETTHYSLFTTHSSCAPCGITLFLFITFVVALPIGGYFLQNPQDFIGRSGQISVFASDSPIKEFLIANAKTLGMFFWLGDCNWRHNYACSAELNPIVAIFFALGVFTVFKQLMGSFLNQESRIKNQGNQNNTSYFMLHASGAATLLTWLFFMSLPATLTSEGLPHALRSIGMIPPVMIVAAAGMVGVGEWLKQWLKRQEERWPIYGAQLQRIRRELLIAFGLLLLLVPAMTFHNYFNRWAYHDLTYGAFSADFAHMGEYLKRLPQDVRAYVLVNMGGTEVQGIPMPAQTVMFLTDTFRQEDQAYKAITYVTKIEDIPQPASERIIIIPMNGHDNSTIALLKARFPEFSFQAPSDFLVFEHH